MEPFIVDVEPTEETHFSLSSHEGEEFIYVMEGTIEVCHGKKCHLIKAGDSIYYDSIVPHPRTRISRTSRQNIGRYLYPYLIYDGIKHKNPW